MGLGRLPIGVSIWKGGSVSSDASNYRTPIARRTRSAAGDGTGMSGNISYVRRPQAAGLRDPPIGVRIYQGDSFASDTSNYRTPLEKRAQSKAGTGTGLSGNTS